MPAAIRIGTSGWSYAAWRGGFYPRGLAPKDWLARYATEFSTVELNATFYRLPAPEQFAKWAAQVPDGFLFAVKAPRLITHLHRLQHCAGALDDFLDAARSLGKKLGPILYQLPPSLPYDPDLLAAFCASLPRKLSNVLEFRHASWFREETYALLGRHRVSLCVSDFPGCEAPLLVTAPPAYLRFHGGRRHRGNYSQPSLQTAADALHRWRQDGIPSFTCFNNTAAARAVTNARTLRDLTRTADCANSA
jgi:uncharacterized protein YecE (DUF72 family)